MLDKVCRVSSSYQKGVGSAVVFSGVALIRGWGLEAVGEKRLARVCAVLLLDEPTDNLGGAVTDMGGKPPIVDAKDKHRARASGSWCQNGKGGVDI